MERVCLALMYACGLRISEAVSLRPEQIDARQGVIRIIGKGNKERLLPLPSSLLTALRAAWTTHGNRQWVLATRARGNHLSPRAVRSALSAACARAGMAHLTPHSAPVYILTFRTPPHKFDDIG